jgi:hypothetical protein
LHYFFHYGKDKSQEISLEILSAIDEFKITQIVDNGQMVQLTLVENVSTEPISQKQMILDNVSKKLDADTKEQVMPLLEAILQAQPTVNIKTYQQTQLTIAMPRSRYEKMGRPQVGNIIAVNLKRL